MSASCIETISTPPSYLLKGTKPNLTSRFVFELPEHEGMLDVSPFPPVGISTGAPNEAAMAETTTRKSVKEGIERHIIGEEGNLVLLRMKLALVLYLPFLGSSPELG